MRVEQRPSWLLILVGAAMIAGACWSLRTAWKGRSPNTGSVPGKRLIAAAGALAVLGAGAAFLLLGAGPNNGSAASTASLTVWALAAIVALVGLAVRAREQHEDRALRRDLGLSTKRRRAHPFLVGFSVYMGLASVGAVGMTLWLMLSMQPGQPSPTVPQNAIFLLAGGAFAGGALAAAAQARRRVARDREIQNVARAETDQPILDPPRWPHQVAADAARELKARWCRPCAPAQALETVLFAAVLIVIGGLFAWAFFTNAVSEAVRLPDRVLGICLAAGVLLGVVIGTAYMPSGGLVSAIKHLLARPQPPDAEQ